MQRFKMSSVKNERAVESEESKWLREYYCETPTDGPLAKGVKFGTVQEKLQLQFPHKNYV